MLRRILCGAVMVILVSSMMSFPLLAAASVTIEGFVKDSKTGDALPGANVLLVKTGLGASTDIQGKYTIRSVPAGNYTLRATYIGYNQKDVALTIAEGQNVKQDFQLVAVSIEGEEVVVTAQAGGQMEAINQQLAALPIVNVVSSARIQELPDANAAESVGRLPGVSVLRDGGEGTKVVIRGLSPKYNVVTIDGVRMAPTDYENRSVDLGMISPYMLEGIEVMKAITADQDADAIGGTVNFKMREATESLRPAKVGMEPGGQGKVGFDVILQGGYNGLKQTYNDYKFVGTVSTRLLDSQLGILAQADVEKRNRASNELGAGYVNRGPVLGAQNPVYITSLNLADIPREKQRVGGSLVLDYRLPAGKINLTNFFSFADTKTQNRSELYNVAANQKDYSTTDSRSKLNVVTNILKYEQDVSLFRFDVKVAHTFSENNSPDNLNFYFYQPSAGLNNANQRADPRTIPDYATVNYRATWLQSNSESDDHSKDREISAWGNVETDLNLSDLVTSKLKLGGRFRYKDRFYDHTVAGGLLYLGSGQNVRDAILNAFPWMKETVASGSGNLPITLFTDPNYDYGEFLRDEYPIGPAIDIQLMKDVMNVIRESGTLEAYNTNAVESTTSNYEGNEYGSAGYFLADVNIGPMVKIIPGVRYEEIRSKYTAPRGNSSFTGSAYNYRHRDTTMEVTHVNWLPMVHVRFKPLDWFDVRFAYTNTLSYPDFRSITPRIDIGLTNVAWNNVNLKPGHSTNFDLYLSAYENTVGLFTAGGFLKQIDDLIFPTGGKIILDYRDYEGLTPTENGKTISTYFNNPNRIDVWGIELDWQTHFWYLPWFLDGLVLNVNYTHVFSEAKYPRTEVRIERLPGPPYIIRTNVDTFYTNRLINQPNDIVNLSLGYDYEGFSARLSMLYQADIFQGENFWPELRSYTDSYLRWDLSVKQELPWLGLQIFANVTNLNAARDISLNAGSGFPAAEQHYGRAADLGVRWRF